MAEGVYLTCAILSALCTVLLVRAYRATRTAILLWSSLAFVGLALNNALLFVDLVVVPEHDLSLARAALGTLSMGTIVFGLVWTSR